MLTMGKPGSILFAILLGICFAALKYQMDYISKYQFLKKANREQLGSDSKWNGRNEISLNRELLQDIRKLNNKEGIRHGDNETINQWGGNRDRVKGMETADLKYNQQVFESINPMDNELKSDLHVESDHQHFRPGEKESDKEVEINAALVKDAFEALIKRDKERDKDYGTTPFLFTTNEYDNDFNNDHDNNKENANDIHDDNDYDNENDHDNDNNDNNDNDNGNVMPYNDKRRRDDTLRSILDSLKEKSKENNNTASHDTHPLRRYQEEEETEENQAEQSDSVRECQPSERVDALQRYCNEHPQVDKAKSLKATVSHLWVDDVNKVLMCTHAKGGSSTWKMILANNTSEKSINETQTGHIMIHGAMSRFDLRTLEEYSMADIKERLEKYHKFMVVRHPYDRLQSFFNDKFVKMGSWNQSLGVNIMRKYHPDTQQTSRFKRHVLDTNIGRGRRRNKTRNQSLNGNITFADFIHWIQDGHEESHWEGPYHKHCHPCLINYDRIVKLETQSSDEEYIINNWLRGRGAGTARNKKDAVSKSVLRTTGKYLGNFKTLDESQMEFLRMRLQVDLDMFGYAFNEETLTAKCAYGDSCC